jgi:hypothetical protein
LLEGFRQEREEFKTRVGDVDGRIGGILDGVKELVWEENAVLGFLEKMEEELVGLQDIFKSLIH